MREKTIRMLDRLRAGVKRGFRWMTPGKWILLLLIVALLWKPVSYYFALYDILHPDWDEVTLITSYSTHGTYTEYTADNGRDLAIEALSNVRLGPPFVLNLVALYRNAASSGTEVLVEIHTAEGVDRICFHEIGGTKGFIQGSGTGYLHPYFFADERYREMCSSTELERTYHGEVKPSGSTEPGYWEPEYR